MIDHFLLELEQFVRERAWEPYHHPRNLVMSLVVEISELLEHFITPLSPLKLTHEVGDVFSNLLYVGQHLNILPVTYVPAPYALNLPLQLTFHAGQLLDHFLWMTDEESWTYTLTSDVEAAYHKLLSTFLALSTSLEIDPLAAAIAKHAHNQQKYPKEVVASREEYYQRKKEWKK